MKFKLFILFYFIYSIGNSQSIDSLLFQTNSIESDTESVNQLYIQGFNFRNSEPDNAWLFAQACQAKAIKSNSIKHLAKAYNLLGVLNYKKTHYLQAIQYQKKALSLNQKINNESGCAINLSNLGNIYSDINYHKLAENSYLQALKINNKLGNTKEITRCLINIGALNHLLKKYDASVINLKQALIFANELGNYELISICNNNIGIALVEQNELDTALLYLQDALKMRTLIDDEINLANSYIQIANVFVKQKKYNEAQNYLLLAENTCTNFEIYDEMVSLYAIKSEFYEAQGNYQLANFWLKKQHQLKDSLTKIDTENADFKMTDETTEISEIENTFTKKNIILVILLSLFMGAIISYFIFRKK